MGSLLQIRDVPEEARRALKARAALRGESLNKYLLDVIAREVGRPGVAEVLARAAARSERVEHATADVIRQGRDERDAHLLATHP